MVHLTCYSGCPRKCQGVFLDSAFWPCSWREPDFRSLVGGQQVPGTVMDNGRCLRRRAPMSRRTFVSWLPVPSRRDHTYFLSLLLLAFLHRHHTSTAHAPLPGFGDEEMELGACSQPTSLKSGRATAARACHNPFALGRRRRQDRRDGHGGGVHEYLPVRTKHARLGIAHQFAWPWQPLLMTPACACCWVS